MARSKGVANSSQGPGLGKFVRTPKVVANSQSSVEVRMSEMSSGGSRRDAGEIPSKRVSSFGSVE